MGSASSLVQILCIEQYENVRGLFLIAGKYLFQRSTMRMSVYGLIYRQGSTHEKEWTAAYPRLQSPTLCLCLCLCLLPMEQYVRRWLGLGDQMAFLFHLVEIGLTNP